MYDMSKVHWHIDLCEAETVEIIMKRNTIQDKNLMLIIKNWLLLIKYSHNCRIFYRLTNTTHVYINLSKVVLLLNDESISMAPKDTVYRINVHSPPEITNRIRYIEGRNPINRIQWAYRTHSNCRWQVYFVFKRAPFSTNAPRKRSFVSSWTKGLFFTLRSRRENSGIKRLDKRGNGGIQSFWNNLPFLSLEKISSTKKCNKSHTTSAVKTFNDMQI